MTTHGKILKKSYDKMQKAINSFDTHFDKCRATRPFILKILRHFDDLEGDIQWSEFLRIAYFKVTKEFKPELDAKISELEELSHYPTTSVPTTNPAMAVHWGWHDEIRGVSIIQYKSDYLKKFRKNLLKLKKKCEDSSIDYYNYLPGYKLPLDVRRHIIGFISMAN
jgi:hypothetical protein